MNNLRQQLAPGLSGVNIGITVLLALMAWPLALLMLAYIFFGQKVGLDLGRPATLVTFFGRVSTAVRAGIEAFNKPST